MKEREALKLALEALEMYVLETNSEFQREAITAIKEALAQPKTVNQFHPDYADEAINEMTLTIQKQAQRIEELEAQVAQSAVTETHKQEPFGYFKPEPFGWTDCAETDEGAIALYEKPQPCPTCEALARTVMMDQSSTDQQQRKPQFKEFIKWAGAQGYDCAQTCNSDTGEWVVLSPMTADLWKAWQAAHGIKE